MFKVIKFIITLFIITNAYSVFSNNITVTNLNDDSNSGSLRWAINSANLDLTITQIDFTSALTGTLTLTSDLPQIINDLTIVGPGANYFTISGDNLYSMFKVATGKTLMISGLTFTQNKSGNGTIFYAGNSNFISSSIVVTGNNGNAFFSASDSTITISNATFTNNGGNLFGSDYGSTPNTTSDILTDYTNRITVTNSSFTGNTGTIFSTERYVKIDTCVFTANTQQIGYFRGVNRYQVLNSTFTNNTGYQLFSFGSWIGDGSNWGATTLGTNNTLFDGNTFTGNTGTVINPGGSVSYDNRTTISNNIFINNGTSYTGSPAVVINNTLDNFISSVTHSVTESKLIVTMSRPVFNTNTGSGTLETNDVELLISGGNATLISSTPTSISVDGNVYTLGIALSGEISGAEMITVQPVTNSIYDGSFNVAGSSQQNNTINLNFLDDDADGVSNFLDLCPNTAPGVLVYPNDGCENTTYPFIMYLDYGSTFNYPSNFFLTLDNNLYFLAYDSNWNSLIYKLSAENVLSTISIPDFNPYNLMVSSSNILYTMGYNNNTQMYGVTKLSTDGIPSVLFSSNTIYLTSIILDSSDNLYFSCHDTVSQSNEIRKISADGTLSVLLSNNTGYIFNLILDNIDNLYFVDSNNGNTKIKKIASDGTISELYNTNGNIDNFKRDTLGNFYLLEYDNNTNAYLIKKLDSLGISANLYNYGASIYPNGIAMDAMDNLYFVTSGEQQLYMISPDGSVIPYGIHTGNQLTNDTNGKVFFDDNLNKKIMGSKEVQAQLVSPLLANFDNVIKIYYDGTYTITPPTSNSSGAFTYSSSDTNVATISGSMVTLVGSGTATITATQAADATYSSASITATLTVNSVAVVTKQGEMTSTNVNYVNKFGVLNALEGLDSNGKVVNAKTIVSVGESYGGGIVAYILQAGDPGYDARVQHGLIAAATDQGTAEWGCIYTPIAEAQGEAIGTGNQNTIGIMNGCSTAGIAARICGDLVLNGYSDWYLPSKDELNKLYINRVAIGGFGNGSYWSSSEPNSSENAWYQYFQDGNQYYGPKNNPIPVRAIRSF